MIASAITAAWNGSSRLIQLASTKADAISSPMVPSRPCAAGAEKPQNVPAMKAATSAAYESHAASSHAGALVGDSSNQTGSTKHGTSPAKPSRNTSGGSFIEQPPTQHRSTRRGALREDRAPGCRKDRKS